MAGGSRHPPRSAQFASRATRLWSRRSGRSECPRSPSGSRGYCENGVISDYHAQAHLDAPLEDVWALVGNPATYPKWWPAAVEIRGDTFEVGDVYTQVLPIGGRRLEYTRIIDRRDELKELRWSCPTTGGFQHWLLTDAQGGTFVDMEMGIHPPAFRYALFDKTVGRWFMKNWAEQAIDGLSETLMSTRKSSAPRPAVRPRGDQN